MKMVNADILRTVIERNYDRLIAEAQEALLRASTRPDGKNATKADKRERDDCLSKVISNVTAAKGMAAVLGAIDGIDSAMATSPAQSIDPVDAALHAICNHGKGGDA